MSKNLVTSIHLIIFKESFCIFLLRTETRDFVVFFYYINLTVKDQFANLSWSFYVASDGRWRQDEGRFPTRNQS